MANYRSKMRGMGGNLASVQGEAGAQIGGVGTMASAQGNVYAPPGTFGKGFGLDLSSATTWSWIWFGVAVAYVFSIYWAHGGRRGGVL